MQRKVIKLGQNSLLVSLPSAWAKKHGIAKGDEVEVRETPQSVIIGTKQTARKSKTLTLGNNPEYAARQINIAYKRGYDELEVHYENPFAYASVLEELRDLIGFEVISSRRQSSTIKSIAVPEFGDFDALFRRVFLAVLDLAEGIEEMSSSRKPAIQTNCHVELAEQNIDRLTDFCKRLLNKHGSVDIADITLFYSMLKDLERVADYYAALARILPSKNLLPALARTRALLRTLYELFYDFNQAKAEQFLERLPAVRSELEHASRKDPATHHLQAIINILNEMSWSVYARAL